MQTDRPEYLTAEQLNALPVGTIVHRPKVAGAFKHVAEFWRPCSSTGRALPKSDAYASWQLAELGVSL